MADFTKNGHEQWPILINGPKQRAISRKMAQNNGLFLGWCSPGQRRFNGEVRSEGAQAVLRVDAQRNDHAYAAYSRACIIMQTLWPLTTDPCLQPFGDNTGRARYQRRNKDRRSAKAGATSAYGGDSPGLVSSHRQSQPRGLQLSAPSNPLLRPGGDSRP